MLRRKGWFDPAAEPHAKPRDAYAGLAWQCRHGGVEIPDSLWRHATIGAGRPYADDQAGELAPGGIEDEVLRVFDAWVAGFVDQVSAKGPVPGTAEAARGAWSTANKG